MSDWTTARVVRDCYGDLWGSDADNPGAWTRLGCDWANAEPERESKRTRQSVALLTSSMPRLDHPQIGRQAP